MLRHVRLCAGARPPTLVTIRGKAARAAPTMARCALWPSVSDPSRDHVDCFSSTLRHRRNMCELDGWAGAAFLRIASLSCKVETQNAYNKGERPCELLRRNAYRAPC